MVENQCLYPGGPIIRLGGWIIRLEINSTSGFGPERWQLLSDLALPVFVVFFV